LKPDVLIRRSLKGFSNHVFWRNGLTEEGGCDFSYDALAVLFRAGARHCGRRADADQILGFESFAQPPDQEGHVCTLPPTVGV
jgi:hypothetical protein